MLEICQIYSPESFSQRMSKALLGHKLIILPSVDSTNSYTSQLFREGKLESGMVVLAYEQKAGRGQRGNKWMSEARKNLTFSILLQPPNILLKDAFKFTMAISIAIAEFVAAETKREVNIKWPNDIYVGPQKIAGILLESSSKNQQILSLIVGIGLNVNQEVFAESRAVSLTHLTSKKYDLLDCLSRLLPYLEETYIQVLAQQYQGIESRYDQMLFQKNKEQSFLYRGQKICATITGVSPDGKLSLAYDGQLIHAEHHEIQYLGKA